jgi:Ca-activated chloride channel family protein
MRRFRIPLSCLATMLAALLATSSFTIAPAHAGGRTRGRAAKRSARGVSLMVVLDRSGSMSGAKMLRARQATSRVLRWLVPTDRVGVLAFDTRPAVVSPFGPVGNRRGHLAAVRRLTAGGGTDFLPALQATLKMLKTAPRAHRRHVIFISDGQSSLRGVLSTIRALVRSGATLSTIALGQGADTAFLRQMAQTGKGRAYATTSQGLSTICRKELRHLGR